MPPKWPDAIAANSQMLNAPYRRGALLASENALLLGEDKRSLKFAASIDAIHHRAIVLITASAKMQLSRRCQFG
jgi:hypothetical protein